MTVASIVDWLRLCATEPCDPANWLSLNIGLPFQIMYIQSKNIPIFNDAFFGVCAPPPSACVRYTNGLGIEGYVTAALDGGVD
jgi:hypothetical protein